MRIPNFLRPSNSRVSVACVVIVAFGVIALGTFRVHQQHQLVTLGYELREAQNELLIIEEEHRRLSLEVSVLTNPERLEHLATALGMVRLGPEQILQIPRKPQPQSHVTSKQKSSTYWALAQESNDR